MLFGRGSESRQTYTEDDRIETAIACRRLFGRATESKAVKAIAQRIDWDDRQQAIEALHAS